jgi:hypothetical protein
MAVVILVAEAGMLHEGRPTSNSSRTQRIDVDDPLVFLQRFRRESLQLRYAPAVHSSDDSDASLCWASVVDGMLNGTKQHVYTQGQGASLKANAAVMIAYMMMSLAVLLMGSQLVYFSVFTTVCSASFYATFEVMLRAPVSSGLAASCSAPLLVGGVVGLLLGMLATCCLELSFLLLGAVSGFICAVEARSVLLLLSPPVANSEWMQYFIIVELVAALIMGLIAYCWQKDILAVATAALGAYGFVVMLQRFLIAYTLYAISDGMSLLLLLCAFLFGVLVQLKCAHK